MQAFQSLFKSLALATILQAIFSAGVPTGSSFLGPNLNPSLNLTENTPTPGWRSIKPRPGPPFALPVPKIPGIQLPSEQFGSNLTAPNSLLPNTFILLQKLRNALTKDLNDLVSQIGNGVNDQRSGLNDLLQGNLDTLRNLLPNLTKDIDNLLNALTNTAGGLESDFGIATGAGADLGSGAGIGSGIGLSSIGVLLQNLQGALPQLLANVNKLTQLISIQPNAAFLLPTTMNTVPQLFFGLFTDLTMLIPNALRLEFS